jgi:hypothetical protein
MSERADHHDLTSSPSDVPEGSHYMAILDHTGDTKIIWSKTNTAEVDAAREHFNSLRKKGYLIYKVVGEDGRQGEQMLTFDPNAERLIATPAPVGG